MTCLNDFAHARAGDKGDTSILMIAPYDPADFEKLRACVTEERVARHFAVRADQVTVVPCEGLGAFTLVVNGLLDGGVTRSGRIDPHGKTVSSHLLAMDCQT